MENNNRILIPLCGGLLVVVGMLLNVMHEANAVTVTVAAQGAELQAIQRQIVLLREEIAEKTLSRYTETDAVRNHTLIMERIRDLEQANG